MPSPYNLEGKVALVTGAASGIGSATSKLFLTLGAKVVSADVARIEGSGASNQRTIVADLRSESQVKAVIADCQKSFGGLHILVNSAGIEMRGTVVDLSEESYDRVMDTNVKTTFLVCKYAIPLLLKTSDRGSIINLSSDLGIQPVPGVDAYAASKGAIISLTKAMSKDWAKSGLRINCVAPGPIDTPLLRRFLDDKSLEFVKSVLLPQGRLGTVDEVAHVVAFLASDESSLVNGAVLTANGGLVG
jgi:NAD(P)-dependent dehydrogenase (short-subunit alcohol dehydrogenase family)